MPTRRGRICLGAAVGLYILARTGGIGELYVLSAAALAFPLLAMLFVRLSTHSVQFDRTLFPKRLFAGHSVRLQVRAKNNGLSRSPPMHALDDAPAGFGGPVRFAVPSLRKNSTEQVQIERAVGLRGRYEIGPLRARITDPFGLASKVSEVAPKAGVLVYPRVEVLAERSPPETRGGGGRSMLHRIAATGDDFYGVRGWQDGDDLRKIHWRSSARRGELMIRQEEVRPFPQATIVVDTRASEHREAGPGSSMEWSISAAASIVWELANQGFAMRLATASSGPGGARWGREAVDPLLAALAIAERSTTKSIAPVLRRAAEAAGAGGALLAIMPPPERDGLAALSRLRRAYSWCGIALLDTASFRSVAGRERALFDQRLAEAERMLARAGWRVAVAGTSDPFRSIWQRLLAPQASRLSWPSRRS